MEIVTTDLSRFGYRELQEAIELLQAFVKSFEPYEEGTDFLGQAITLCFNTESGKVFLSDDDYNTGVLEGGRVVQFFSCPNCGYEGTNEEAIAEGKNFEANNGYCSKKCAK